MKQQNSKTEKKDFNKFLLTGCFLICISAGWLIGSETTEAFSQSTGKNFRGNKEEVVVPLIASHGEILPTIILREFSVVASKQ